MLRITEHGIELLAIEDKGFRDAIVSLIDRHRRRLLREQILDRDGNSCHYCGGKMLKGSKDSGDASATLEHVMCVADGGQDTLDNCVLACRACNSLRGRLPYRVFREVRKVLLAIWEPCTVPKDRAKTIIHSLEVLYGSGMRKPG